MIEAIVARCIARPWLVIVAAALVTAAALFWTVTHFAINTDTARLISPDVPYRQDEIAFDKAFPQTTDLIVAVIDAETPEQAETAAETLAQGLRAHPDVFHSVRRPDATPFLAQNGLLLLPEPELGELAEQMARQRYFLTPLARDPSLRGLTRALTIVLRGAQSGAMRLDQALPLFNGLAATVDGAVAGRTAPLSWQGLMSGEAPNPLDRRKILLIKPALDFNALEPGADAIDLLRQTAVARGLIPAQGVSVRLTGPVPLADEEFATVAENALLNMALTVMAIAVILFLALRYGRIIVAVLVTLFVGLIGTSGLGLLMVGELNLISVAFAVLFIGLGVDFGIQVSVRYRAERHALGDLNPALRAAGRGVSLSLTLAAVSLLAGFFSFLPTEFRGVSELGLIAGLGMIIAYVASLTLLPALLAVLRPPAEKAPVETTSLAAVDRWIAGHRRLVIVATAVLVIGGIPFLLRLPFDSNPMNLRSQTVESVATFLDLSKNPDTAPNTIDVVVPNEAAVPAMAARLAALPEVARTISLATFLPDDQERKLAVVRKTAEELATVFEPIDPPDPPDDEENVAALKASAAALGEAAGRAGDPGAIAARRLQDAFAHLLASDAAHREAAQTAVFANFAPLVQRLKLALSAEPITREKLPADLVSDWVASDGRARIEVSPKGDSNDNAVLARFADAVRAVAPHASGAPIGIVEAGHTIVRAFAEAGLYALIVITIILWLALRRLMDVVLALGPLVLAGAMTLEAAYLIGLPLNFANIIALPLMFGVGVAFHIYYLIAWRAGVVDVLASSLTRAIFFSALTTGTAFGSLWASSHPGTSSMGELLALSLVFTLLAAFIVVPAFLGPPREAADAEALRKPL